MSGALMSVRVLVTSIYILTLRSDAFPSRSCLPFADFSPTVTLSAYVDAPVQPPLSQVEHYIRVPDSATCPAGHSPVQWSGAGRHPSVSHEDGLVMGYDIYLCLCSLGFDFLLLFISSNVG